MAETLLTRKELILCKEEKKPLTFSMNYFEARVTRKKFPNYATMTS